MRGSHRGDDVVLNALQLHLITLTGSHIELGMRMWRMRVILLDSRILLKQHLKVFAERRFDGVGHPLV